MKVGDICLKIGKTNESDNPQIYHGFDMSGYGEDDDRTQEGNLENKIKNFRLIKDNFPNEFKDLKFEFFNLWCWKGSIWWGERLMKNIVMDFSGWGTEDIIYWLYNSKPWIYEEHKNEIRKENDEMMQNLIEQEIQSNNSYDIPVIDKSVCRIVTKDDRYNVLSRQKWRCNMCGERLKYSKNSSWEGKIAHIDHIHPFSEKEAYTNGKENINETINLQALCPECNLKKGKKRIH